MDGFVHHVSKFNSYNGNLLEPVYAYTTLAGRVAYMFDNLPSALPLSGSLSCVTAHAATMTSSAAAI